MNAAALLAVDPTGLGGAVLRGPPGPGRERWLAGLRRALPQAAVLRRVPLHVSEDRLLGGIDLAATLRAGRPIAQRGVLAEADGGVLVLASAERLAPATAARIAAVLDGGEAVTERDGLARRDPARIGVVALDEGGTEEHVAAALSDRLAFHLDPEAEAEYGGDPAAARAQLPFVSIGDEVIEALCMAAAALGIGSLRAPLLAVRAARAAAALAGRPAVLEEDAAVAATLVLAPRATTRPAPPEEEPAEDEEPAPDEGAEPDGDSGAEAGGTIADRVLAAAAAALPPGLLSRLAGAAGGKAGKAGGPAKGGARGRPAGTRTGAPGAGLRLNLMETLRAAAPWQTVRGRDGRIEVRPADFRVTRRTPRSESTTIFLVDASGSQALNRLAEVKGAVELLLADCYIRRDQVALLAFRGRSAELVLPPTRSLVRAKRSLAGLPGGGGTPLAAGLEAGCALADAVRRRGGTPTVVLLTDGQANVGSDGKGGRAAAERDAGEAARRFRHAGHAAIMVDSSIRPQPAGQRLAAAMGCRYVVLPFATAKALSREVRAALA